MNLIYETSTGRAVAAWDGGEYAVFPTPGNGQTQIEIDITADEFMAACRQSAGVPEGSPVGDTFLHDTPQVANKSDRTQGIGVKVGHKAVESSPPEDPRGIADVIQETRVANGTPLSAPVTIPELRAAEAELRSTRAVAAQR